MPASPADTSELVPIVRDATEVADTQRRLVALRVTLPNRSHLLVSHECLFSDVFSARHAGSAAYGMRKVMNETAVSLLGDWNHVGYRPEAPEHLVTVTLGFKTEEDCSDEVERNVLSTMFSKDGDEAMQQQLAGERDRMLKRELEHIKQLAPDAVYRPQQPCLCMRILDGNHRHLVSMLAGRRSLPCALYDYHIYESENRTALDELTIGGNRGVSRAQMSVWDMFILVHVRCNGNLEAAKRAVSGTDFDRRLQVCYRLRRCPRLLRFFLKNGYHFYELIKRLDKVDAIAKAIKSGYDDLWVGIYSACLPLLLLEKQCQDIALPRALLADFCYATNAEGTTVASDATTFRARAILDGLRKSTAKTAPAEAVLDKIEAQLANAAAWMGAPSGYIQKATWQYLIQASRSKDREALSQQGFGLPLYTEAHAYMMANRASEYWYQLLTPLLLNIERPERLELHFHLWQDNKSQENAGYTWQDLVASLLGRDAVEVLIGLMIKQSFDLSQILDGNPEKAVRKKREANLKAFHAKFERASNSYMDAHKKSMLGAVERPQLPTDACRHLLDTAFQPVLQPILQHLSAAFAASIGATGDAGVTDDRLQTLSEAFAQPGAPSDMSTPLSSPQPIEKGKKNARAGKPAAAIQENRSPVRTTVERHSMKLSGRPAQEKVPLAQSRRSSSSSPSAEEGNKTRPLERMAPAMLIPRSSNSATLDPHITGQADSWTPNLLMRLGLTSKLPEDAPVERADEIIAHRLGCLLHKVDLDELELDLIYHCDFWHQLAAAELDDSTVDGSQKAGELLQDAFGWQSDFEGQSNPEGQSDFDLSQELTLQAPPPDFIVLRDADDGFRRCLDSEDLLKANDLQPDFGWSAVHKIYQSISVGKWPISSHQPQPAIEDYFASLRHMPSPQDAPEGFETDDDLQPVMWAHNELSGWGKIITDLESIGNKDMALALLGLFATISIEAAPWRGVATVYVRNLAETLSSWYKASKSKASGAGEALDKSRDQDAPNRNANVDASMSADRTTRQERLQALAKERQKGSTEASTMQVESAPRHASNLQGRSQAQVQTEKGGTSSSSSSARLSSKMGSSKRGKESLSAPVSPDKKKAKAAALQTRAPLQPVPANKGSSSQLKNNVIAARRTQGPAVPLPIDSDSSDG